VIRDVGIRSAGIRDVGMQGRKMGRIESFRELTVWQKFHEKQVNFLYHFVPLSLCPSVPNPFSAQRC